jgi:DNA polymerase III delta subunit
LKLNKTTLEQSTKKFLVKSKDPFLTEDFIEQLCGLIPNYQVFKCPDLSAFLEISGSSSLFEAGNRVIIFSDVVKEDLEAIVEVIDTDSEDVYVLLENSPILKTKTYTLFKSLCTYVEFKEPTESERSVWVKKWLTAEGLSCDDEIPGYIVNRSGSDLCSLRNEVHKISMLLLESTTKKVTKSVCDDVIASNNASQYFVFMENFFRKKLSEVLSELKKVDEYSYIKLLHFMLVQVERQYKIAIYKEQGYTAEQVAEIVGVPAFIVKTKLYAMLSFYGKTKLLMLKDLLNKLDIELRLTKFPKYSVFETYLLKAFKI